MPWPDLNEGEVYFFDLTDHTGISANTLKDPHFVAVIMNQKKLTNLNHKTIVCVPMTSKSPTLWDEANDRPRLYSHYSITPEKYRQLSHDTLIKCEQIYTINREFFTDYRFTLDKSDLMEVRRRMVHIIGA